MKIMEIIGPNIKEYRENFGYSQEQIAKYLGVERSTISHYETAQREASLTHLSRLADLFGIEIEDFSEQNLEKKAAGMAFSFRRESLSDEDLESLASFQKIVSNYIKMKEILRNNESK